MTIGADRQRVTVLGATGSIGQSTLDVIGRHPDRYHVHALVAHRSVDDMVILCQQHQPDIAIMACPNAAQQLESRLAQSASAVQVKSGEAAAIAAASGVDVDTVMAAVVGFAGLKPALAAAQSGKRLLLANKEALVSAGNVFMTAVEEGGCTLLPIDSEHNAMFQCLSADERARPDMSSVEKIVLTASGGPFRGWQRAELNAVTPEQACAHPNWSMGRKISVDSATLMNKGLELAEACWLFRQSPSDIEVVVHPQSIVHSMIHYRDGSVLAQLGNPDMRTPIAYGLAWPNRVSAGVAPLDIVGCGRLDFQSPDLDAFPCLRLAQEAIGHPGGMCALNAANEVAVAAFLDGLLSFTDIDRLNEAVLTDTPSKEPTTLTEVEQFDGQARHRAHEWLAQRKRVVNQRARQ